jgi:hypothetical protein
MMMDLREIGIDVANWVRLSSPVAGFCEHGNEPSEFHKGSRLFFDKLSDYQLFKE